MFSPRSILYEIEEEFGSLSDEAIEVQKLILSEREIKDENNE